MTHPIFNKSILGDFRPPDDPQAKVWRFMSFARYVWLLEQQALFFARAATLGDPFEGAKPRRTLQLREKFMSFHRKRRNLIGGSDLARDLTFVSCWHLNEFESQGMWKLYVEGSEGVAIQSRFEILDQCLRANSRWKRDIYLGCIKYIDYESANIMDDYATPFIYKRHSFRHENEVRAIIFARSFPKVAPAPEELIAGRSVDIDVNSLVEAVYTSPYSQPWFHDLVCLVSKKYELRAPVRASDLKALPMF